MAVGSRDEPEKKLATKLKSNSFQSFSRKAEKVDQNRKFRRQVKKILTRHIKRSMVVGNGKTL